MANQTLAQLLTPQTIQQVFQVLLGFYQSNGFPTQSWQPGGTERTRLMAIATAVVDLASNFIPNIAAGGFVDFASGTGWMPLLAQEMYNLAQNPATFTVGKIVLTSAPGVGPINVTAGNVIAVFAATGNRYILNQNGTIPLNGSVTLSFTAEKSGVLYNDPSNSGAISLVTPIPGVTLTNPAGSFSTVAQVGAGTGTLTLGGVPVGSHLVVVRVDSSGQSGAASWSYQLDGQPFVSAGAVVTLNNVGGTGINITLTNGSSNPSFIQGDTYTFQTPGSWVTSQGSNVESDALLAARCRARWATLPAVGVPLLYQFLATSTPNVGSQVTQVIVVPDPNINNKINIVIAGPAGALPAGVISSVQAYISSRVPGTVNATVVTPSTLNVTLAGTVTLAAATSATAQAAIQVAMTNYFNSIPINGTVKVSVLVELIMQVAGVLNVNVSSVTINGSAVDLMLGSSTTYVLPSLQALGFTYVTQ